jgi:uncharacterized protein (TIGR02271 family)
LSLLEKFWNRRTVLKVSAPSSPTDVFDGAAMTEEQEVAVIPLVEERLDIAKREVETGRVRVRIHVDEREETLAAELTRDAVEIRRVARNVPLAELPTVRLEGNVTVIPVVEEQLVVEKRLVLVEEIHVLRKREVVNEAVPATVRAERAEIERDGAVETPVGAEADAAQ